MSTGAFTVLDCYTGKIDTKLAQTRELRAKLAAIRDPTLDDINTHNMFIVRKYLPHVAVGFEWFKRIPEKYPQFLTRGATNKIRINMQGNTGTWIAEQVINIKLEAVSQAGCLSFYANLPGARVFSRVKLVSNEIIVDDYIPEDLLMEEFRIPKDRRESTLLILGQEEVHAGVYYHKDRAVQQIFQFTDGAQTPKQEQPILDLWVPLYFWYNSAGNALPIAKFSTKQFNIDLELAPLEKLLFAMVGDDLRGPQIDKLRILACNLYTRNIYVNDEIRDIFARAGGMSIIRTRRRHTEIVDKSSDSILLNNLKTPIEYVAIGFRPVENESSPTHWTKFAVVEKKCVPIPAFIEKAEIAPIQQLVMRSAVYNKYHYPVDTLGFTAYGTKLFDQLAPMFYNRFLPTKFKYITDVDKGKMLVPFCINPGSKDVNGYFNNSRGREYYLNYESSWLGPANKAQLYVTAYCINFLIFESNNIKISYL